MTKKGKNGKSKYNILAITLIMSVIALFCCVINCTVVNNSEVRVDEFSELDEDVIFSTKRLLINKKDTKELKLGSGANILADYGDLYLVEFNDIEKAKEEYVRIKDRRNNYIVESDISISIADNNNDEVDLKYNQENNPLDNVASMDVGKTYQDEYVIALIDTGASEYQNVVERVSVIGNFVDDDNGHGNYMVDEIISQDSNAKIISIKAFDSNGKGSISSTYAAIKYAISKKVKVINLSVSGYSAKESTIMKDVIKEANAAGIIVVGAAGNNNDEINRFCPGNIEEAIIIGTAGEDGRWNEISNYGDTVDYLVTANSSSVATANFTGFLSKNNLDINNYYEEIEKAKDTNNFIWSPVFERKSDEEAVNEEIDTSGLMEVQADTNIKSMSDLASAGKTLSGDFVLGDGVNKDSEYMYFYDKNPNSSSVPYLTREHISDTSANGIGISGNDCFIWVPHVGTWKQQKVGWLVHFKRLSNNCNSSNNMYIRHMGTDANNLYIEIANKVLVEITLYKNVTNNNSAYITGTIVPLETEADYLFIGAGGLTNTFNLNKTAEFFGPYNKDDDVYTTLVSWQRQYSKYAKSGQVKGKNGQNGATTSATVNAIGSKYNTTTYPNGNDEISAYYNINYKLKDATGQTSACYYANVKGSNTARCYIGYLGSGNPGSTWDQGDPTMWFQLYLCAGSDVDNLITLNKTIELTFDVNGGSSVNGQTVASGKQIASNKVAILDTTSATMPTTSRTGYKFTGWKSTSGTTYNAGSSYTFSTSTTLTAQWEEIKKVNIGICLNGGSLSPNHGSEISVVEDNNKKYIKLNDSRVIHTIYYGESLGSTGLADYNNSNYINIERAGYTVNNNAVYRNGTSTSTCYNNTYDQSTAYSASDFDDCSTESKTVQLYVNWVPITYNISYTLNSGANSTSNPSTYNVTSNNITLTNPTRTGYTFTGWNKSVSNLGWQAGFINLNTGEILDNTSFPNSYYSGKIGLKSGVTYTLSGYGSYATNDIVWRLYDTSDNYLTLGQNGQGIRGSTYTPTQDCYVRILLFQNNTETQRNGIVLTGNNEKSTIIPKGSTGNISLVANWTVNNYTLTFNANGGTVSPQTKSVTYGNTYTDLPTPTKAGYTFKGWYADLSESNDYINYGRNYMYTNRISIHASAYMTDWSTYDARIFSCTESGGWNIEPSNGYIRFAMYDSGIGYKNATANITWASLSPGWHDFDMVFDGTNLKGYVDGVNVATSETYASGTIGYNSTNSIFVGGEATGSAITPSGGNFIGYIGNIVINNNTTLIPSTTYNTITAPAQDLTLYAKWEPNTATVTIKKDNANWSSSGMKLSLYQNGSVTSFTDTNATKSEATVTWSGVPNGTYRIYASRSDFETDTIQDTGVNLVVTNGVGTQSINYYTLNLAKGTGISSVNRNTAVYLKGKTANIDATVANGYTWEGWSVTSGDSPD